MTTNSQAARSEASTIETRAGPEGWRDRVSEDSADSFPASDPPSWTPLHVGAPRHDPPRPLEGE
jgi:hypothetical protein